MIGIHEPKISSDDIKFLSKAARSNWVSTGGPMISRFESALKKYLKAKFVLVTQSGTASLQLAIKLLRPKLNDEILVPTITFVSPVNAIIYNNCKPIFFDCDNSLNIDLNKVKEFLHLKTKLVKKSGRYLCINKKTKKRIIAIIVTHVFGKPVEIDEIRSICKKYNISLIEDAAESLGSKFTEGKIKNKFTSTGSRAGCISFNGNKIITTGSGGALITNNKKDYEYLRYLLNQAKDDNDRFIHNELGYNYRMNNLQAALGLSQLKRIETFLKCKHRILKDYKRFLLNNDYIEIISTLNNNYNNWLILIKIKKKLNQNKLLKYFKSKKIQLRAIWYPNHKQKYLKKYESYKIYNALNYKKYYCLPSSNFLRQKEIKKICDLLNKYVSS